MDKQFSAQLYPANFDDNSFNQYTKNEYNRLSEDDCYKNRRDNDNNKRLKFYTTNYIDLANAQTTRNNFFGIDIEDNQFVPAPQVIDKYSSLVNGQDGNQLTNCKVRNGFGQLPVQLPFKGQGHHGDVCIEDTLRNYLDPKKQSCLPKETNFYNRSFEIFSNDIEVPMAIKSVETSDKGFYLGRVGLSSRFDHRYGNNWASSYQKTF